MKVDSSGGPITSTTAGSAGAAEGDDGEDSGADTAPEPTTAAKPKPKAGGKSGSDLSASSAPKAPKRLSVTTEAAVSGETKAGSSTQRVGAVEDSVGQPSGSSAAQVPVQRSAVPTALTDGTASDRAVQALVSAPAAPNSTVSRWMSTVLSAVGLAPSADGDAPELPGDSPLMLAGLAALRRQTQQALTGDEALARTVADPSQSSLMVAEADTGTGEPMMLAAAVANSAPVVPAQPTGIPDPVTGVVSDTVVASDPDANTLSYSVTGTSANGGTVSINSATGAYTYTPSPAARLAAGTTAGADTDTFTVSVFDGQTTTTGTVPVYVSPTQLNVGTPIAVQRDPAGVAVYQNTTYVINQRDKTVSVIDTNPNSATFNKVVATIKLASSPSDIVLNSTGTRAYVAMNGNASVAVIDTTAKTVITNVPVGSTPTGIAISPDNSRVYVTNGGSSTVSVIDTARDIEISHDHGGQPAQRYCGQQPRRFQAVSVCDVAPNRFVGGGQSGRQHQDPDHGRGIRRGRWH